jgi:hypothetical protein
MADVGLCLSPRWGQQFQLFQMLEEKKKPLSWEAVSFTFLISDPHPCSPLSKTNNRARPCAPPCFVTDSFRRKISSSVMFSCITMTLCILGKPLSLLLVRLLSCAISSVHVCILLTLLMRYIQQASGFQDYTLDAAYPDGSAPTPAFKKNVSAICSGFCS